MDQEFWIRIAFLGFLSAGAILGFGCFAIENYYNNQSFEQCISHGVDPVKCREATK